MAPPLTPLFRASFKYDMKGNSKRALSWYNTWRVLVNPVGLG